MHKKFGNFGIIELVMVIAILIVGIIFAIISSSGITKPSKNMATKEKSNQFNIMHEKRNRHHKFQDE
jgi:uncharacterized membrane protein